MAPSRAFLAVVVALLAVQPAAAAETPWQEVAPNARTRLVTSDALGPDRTTLVGVELDMPQRMKTYWRISGETGIPTEIGTAGSAGVSLSTVRWPYPTIDNAGGYHDYVYYGRVVIPLELTIGEGAATLQLSVVLGICDEICVPASASFALPLDFAKADAGNALRLKQALADVPLPWDGQDGFDPQFDPAGRFLSIRLPSEEIAPQSLIADIVGTPILFGPPQKSPDGLVLLPLLGGGQPAVGQVVTLTFDTPRGPFEVDKSLLLRSTVQ